MLAQFKKLNYISLFIIILSFVGGCSGNSSWENRFSPDPELSRNQSPNPTNTPETVTTLPRAFPRDIPRYPNAKIVSVDSNLTSTQGKTNWESSDPVNLFKTRYQAEFEQNNWEIIQPFNPDTEDLSDRLIAQNQDRKVAVYLSEIGSTNQFTLEYKPLDGEIAVSPSPTPSDSLPVTPNTFSDRSEIPQPLQKYVLDLANLGVLTTYKGTSEQFKPNEAISRREYARWLFNVYNHLYRNTPEKQIRPSSPSSTPLFQDVSSSDPDFEQIQGLAEAGIIPSSLTGDTSQSLFRPEANLIREDLLIWKVPIDLRKALPSATIDNVKETWGFQDTAKIDPKALRALYADFQNGDRSNVKRVFGYTTLFNPKKPVTRAEASAALWYFGFQDQGISAQEALTIENTPNLDANTPNSPTPTPSNNSSN